VEIKLERIRRRWYQWEYNNTAVPKREIVEEELKS
jgi:hypothetical protein